jgi:hypothetical protein
MVGAIASPDSWEVASLVGSLVSIALAGFAIWQASQFFRWSNSAQAETEKAARGIEASVRKLEDLFDRLYSDTFGMMRETVSDMRKHMWSSDSGDQEQSEKDVVAEIEKRTARNIEGLRDEVRDQIAEVVNRVGATNDQVQDLEGQIGTVVDRAIEASRAVQEEAVKETLNGALMAELRAMRRQGKRRVEADEIVSSLRDRFSLGDILGLLQELHSEGIIRIEEDPDSIGPTTEIAIVPAPAPQAPSEPVAQPDA